MRLLLPLAALPLLAACSACDNLVDHGQLSVTVAPVPATAGQTITVTLTNGTQRPATFNRCANVALRRQDGAAWTTVLPTPGTACTAELQHLPAGTSATALFALSGQRAGTYRVDFTPVMDGGEALALSAPFEVRP